MDSPKTTAGRWDILFLCVGVGLTYAGSLGNDFTFDDAMVIRDAQPLLTHLQHLPDFFRPAYFSLSHESTYRPVVTLSYLVDQQLWGLRPEGYHLQSILWHTLVVLGVYRLSRTLFSAHPNGRTLSLLAASLFAIHPITTETVDNASFREDALAAAFGVWAIQMSFLRFRGRGALVAFLYGLALFSKESSALVPLLLWHAHQCRSDDARATRRDLRSPLLAMMLVSVFWGGVRFGLLTSHGRYGEYPAGDLLGTMLRMPVVFARALRLFVVPWPLCADYSGVLPFRDPLGLPHVAGAAICVLYLAWAIWAWKHSPLLGFGLTWFVVALAPVSNLLPLPIPFAERFLYLPVVGLCMAVATLAGPWLSPRAGIRKVAWFAVGVIAFLYFSLTQLRHHDWKDNETLWTATAKHFPTAWGAYVGLGVAKNTADIPRARQALETALSLGPNGDALPGIEEGLGILSAQEGHHDEAISWFRRSLQRAPRARTWVNLAFSLWAQGESDPAVEACLDALRLNPFSGHSYALLSMIAQEQGKTKDAEFLYRRAMERTPYDVEEILAYARMLKSKQAQSLR